MKHNHEHGKAKTENKELNKRIVRQRMAEKDALSKEVARVAISATG